MGLGKFEHVPGWSRTRDLRWKAGVDWAGRPAHMAPWAGITLPTLLCQVLVVSPALPLMGARDPYLEGSEFHKLWIHSGLTSSSE